MGRKWSEWIRNTEAGTASSIFTVVLIIGIILGAIVPSDLSLKEPWGSISNYIGWIYFTAWSISFYPQVITNYFRKSVVGLSFDYIALNFIGYICYSIYNGSLLYNNAIRQAYHKQFNSDPAVRSNDVFFAFHALLLTIVNVIQIVKYDRGNQRITRYAITLISGMLISITIFIIIIFSTGNNTESNNNDNNALTTTWLGFLTFLSYIKLTTTLTKYIPQVFLNYRRKSTVGWTVYNVLLDFTGGLLSLGQLLLDCWIQNDWSGIAGDPVKFGLGFVSMIFDIVFMTQHYILYPSSQQHEELSETNHLFSGTNNDNDNDEEKGKFLLR